MSRRERIVRAVPTRCGSIDRHARALHTSSLLTKSYRNMYKRDMADVTPQAVIRVLNKAKVSFVLMGVHGIGGWRDQPRATQDVDILVEEQDHGKAVRAVKKAYPDLIVQDFPAVTRFLDPHDNQPVIDLMKPEEDLYKEVFTNPVKVGRTHRIPNLDMALATKYAAMTAAQRKADKRALDEGDFINMVMTNHDKINSDVLYSLGEMVRNGGGREIQSLVAEAHRGNRLHYQVRKPS